MTIIADDWHFKQHDQNALLVDLFLSNGQHALLEVNPMKVPQLTNGQFPEMIVFCELLGERISNSSCPSRWISRPPAKSCPWSNVQIPPALMQQIREKLGYGELAPA